MSAFNLWRRVWIVAQRFARTLKPFVEISVPLALIWFAFRTDRVQDAQLEIAKTQADIARQRSRISNAANLAAFSGQVQRALDEQGAPTGHTLVRIRNEGAAFTQVHIDAFTYIPVSIGDVFKPEAHRLVSFVGTTANVSRGPRVMGDIADVIDTYKPDVLSELRVIVDDRLVDRPRTSLALAS